MYRKVLLFILLFVPAYAWAQEPAPEGHTFEAHVHEQGLFVGGAVTFWTNLESKSILFHLHPEAGWRFNNNWAAGVLLGYGFESERHGQARENHHSLRVSPFVRFYYLHRGPFNLYLDGGVGYNYATPIGAEGSTGHHGFELGVRPGACVDLTEGLCLCLRMGFLGYRKNYFTGEEPGLSSNGFGVRFAPEELMIGLELEF